MANKIASNISSISSYSLKSNAMKLNSTNQTIDESSNEIDNDIKPNLRKHSSLERSKSWCIY
jgi:hypothetical protein